MRSHVVSPPPWAPTHGPMEVAGRVTKTPWGEASELRSRRLPPGPSQPRQKANANQRERLLAATVSVVAEKGYEPMRVADIVAVSGVSRSAFYKHFDNKQDCFLATLDAITSLAVPQLFESFENTPGTWRERLEEMLRALVRLLVAQPAAARVVWVEGYAAGPEAVERIEQFDDKVEDYVIAALGESPEHAGLPREVVRAVCGGLRKIANTRVREGRERELFDLIPELVEWSLSYHTPQERLRRPRKPPPDLIDPPSPPSDARDRILAAVTDIVAEGGYPTMKITDIASRAAVSLTTFYADFEGKQDAFVAAIERGQQRVFEAAQPVYRAAEDWPHAVAYALHAFFAAFYYDPAMGHLGGVGAYEGGRPAMKSRDDSIMAFYAFLDEGYKRAPDVPRVVPEAVGASIYALMTHQVRHRGAERLYEIAPTAAFMALAPFIGSDEAATIANDRPKGPTTKN
jgi:AcrR family transcriptional regulator